MGLTEEHVTASRGAVYRKQGWARSPASHPGVPRGDMVPPTFRNPGPRRRQASSRCTRPSCRPAASQHSAGKNQLRPWPGCSSVTITWLTYQAGEGPWLSCHRRSFRSRPSGAGVLGYTAAACQQGTEPPREPGRWTVVTVVPRPHTRRCPGPRRALPLTGVSATCA